MRPKESQRQASRIRVDRPVLPGAKTEAVVAWPRLSGSNLTLSTTTQMEQLMIYIIPALFALVVLCFGMAVDAIIGAMLD